MSDPTTARPPVPTPSPTTLAARNAVALTFFLNGLLFATWVSRIPEARRSLGLDNGQLGLLLLAIAAGSLLSMPTSGALISRLGTTPVVRAAGLASLVGLVVAALAIWAGSVPLAAVGLFAYGIGTGVWDVAMNVEGAAVEQHLGRTVMPRFHAAFSFGTVLGSAVGAVAVAAGVPALGHLPVLAVLAVAVLLVCTQAFLPDEVVGAEEDEGPRPSSWSAWTEPRTLLIGLMVLALALTEGTANDWLALALVDGYDVPEWVGVAGFALFVTAMTAGRLGGPVLLDRFGRVPVLWATMAAAGGGVLLIVLGQSLVVVALGVVLWGLGASLGFPVGMSAAADDPKRAAARVSVVSTIGYAAFLSGPPLIGFVADHVGTLDALLVVAVVLVPSALVVPAARARR
ncbi:MFS transporter [Nocardioides aurantiacus]|uniref:MFS transporter n=1 Tax=Nocardioides aurantiacus TaxID=86796 RepID=UPI00403F3DFB